MRISRFVDAGFRMLAHMARRPVGTQFLTMEIASEIGVPPWHLTKVSQRLARSGIILAARGRKRGGVYLSRLHPPERISLSEVYEVLSEGQKFMANVDAPQETSLAAVMSLGRDAFLRELGRYTVLDLVAFKKEAVA